MEVWWIVAILLRCDAAHPIEYVCRMQQGTRCSARTLRELRHALRGNHRDSICSHNTFLARMKKKEKREYRWAHAHISPLFFFRSLAAGLLFFLSFSASSIPFPPSLLHFIFYSSSSAPPRCISHCNNATSVTGTNLLHPWDRMRLDNSILPLGYLSFHFV